MSNQMSQNGCISHSLTRGLLGVPRYDTLQRRDRGNIKLQAASLKFTGSFEYVQSYAGSRKQGRDFGQSIRNFCPQIVKASDSLVGLLIQNGTVAFTRNLPRILVSIRRILSRNIAIETVASEPRHRRLDYLFRISVNFFEFFPSGLSAPHTVEMLR